MVYAFSELSSIFCFVKNSVANVKNDGKISTWLNHYVITLMFCY